MIKEKLGPRIDGWVHAVFPFLFWRPIHPDALSLFGALVASAAGPAFAVGAFGWAGGLLLVGGFFDLVDGVVARHFGTATRFGALLDSSLDRVVDIVAVLGLVVHFAGAGDRAGISLSSVILVSSVLTSYVKARAAGVVERMPGGLLERGERIGLLALGALTGWLWPILWVLAIGSSVTLAQRIDYARSEMQRLDRLSARSRAGGEGYDGRRS